MGRLNYERAAAALVDAAYLGDEESAARHGITTRTILNYRHRLGEGDEDLSALFEHKRALAEQAWADDLVPAIRSSVAFLARAAQHADERDPDVIHAIAGSLKILTQVSLTKRALDERLTHAD